jgi:hypothetical protein
VLAAPCGVFVRRRFPFAGRPFAQPLVRRGMPGFFALAAEAPALRAARLRMSGSGGRRLPAPIGWGSTRRDSVTGARCRSIPSARRPPVPSRLGHGARIRRIQSRFSALEVRIPRAFHGAVLSMSIRLFAGVFHRGIRADLSSSMHPEHPCCDEEMFLASSQAKDLRPRWTTRLAGPRGSPRTRRQDASTPLLQPTFTSRALDIDTTSGDCVADRSSGEERRRHLSVRGSTPDHLAVIRPPAAACLTARLPASVRSTAARRLAFAGRRALRAPCGGRAPGLFRLTGSPVDRCPLAPPCGLLVVVPASGPTSSRLSTAHRGHVNA